MPSSLPDDLRAKIIELARERMKPAAIHRAIGKQCSQCTVYGVIKRARDEGLDVPHFKTGPQETDELLAKLAPFAAARGMSVKWLARRILRTVVEENLVDAVLDDRD